MSETSARPLTTFLALAVLAGVFVGLVLAAAVVAVMW